MNRVMNELASTPGHSCSDWHPTELRTAWPATSCTPDVERQCAGRVTAANGFGCWGAELCPGGQRSVWMTPGGER